MPSLAPFHQRVRAFLGSRYFVWTAATVLILTTVYWSLLGAIVHQHNADQLIDPKLFQSTETLQKAVFPSQHTFLLKWPLFILIQLTHNASWAYIAMTVFLSLITVSYLAWLMSRIEKRPLSLGVLYLALTSVLLLIPIEPSPGSLLPTSFAMITTRNIEYLFFIAGLIFVLKAKFRLKNTALWLALGCFTILFASDQLFSGISIGGAILFFIVYLLLKKPAYQHIAIRWLLISIGAFFAASVLTSSIDGLQITHITGTTAGPYAIESDVKQKIAALLFTILGIFTNFGANPIHDVLAVKDLPVMFLKRLLSLEIITYLINGVVVLMTGIAGWRLFKRSFSKQQTVKNDITISMMLGTATMAAIMLFIATNHYYPVDSRYLTLSLFTGFVILATYLARKQSPFRYPVRIISVLIVGIAVGVFGAYNTFNASQTTYEPVIQENQQIAVIVDQLGISAIVGDYWRVVPVSNMAKTSVAPVALGDCSTLRTVLTSKQWSNTTSQRRFAYLVTTQKGSTGFPACSPSDGIAMFGKPGISHVISGTADHPTTVLLVYDNARKPYDQLPPRKSLDHTLLKPLASLEDATCEHKTILQIIPHQDDDILFMNPALLHDVQAGNCIRTIYLTAGDAGVERGYWIKREEGARAAYSQALGLASPQWATYNLQFTPNTSLTATKLQDSQQVTLFFLHLPDGNPSGNGFGNHHNESLQRVWNGSITTIHDVESHTAFTRDDLVTGLGQLMTTYQPAEVRTLETRSSNARYPDHSDHITTGQLTRQVFKEYKKSHQQATIAYYVGYSGLALSPNVTGDDLATKQAMFYAYAALDTSTCTTTAACASTAYKLYLERQYTDSGSE